MAALTRSGHNQTFVMTAENCPASAIVDYVKVGRESHELVLRHGQDAHRYALRLFERTKEEGDAEAAAFWHAVHMALVPRAQAACKASFSPLRDRLESAKTGPSPRWPSPDYRKLANDMAAAKALPNSDEIQ